MINLKKIINYIVLSIFYQMEEKFSFLLFIIALLDIYFNYNVYEFPQYHRVRIYSGIFTLSSIFIPFLLIIFICLMGCLLFCQLVNNNHMRSCTVCFTIISSICVVNLSLGSLILQVFSIYLYFVSDGSLKIKSRMIKILMVLCLLSIFIKIFFAVCNLVSSLKNSSKSESSEDLTATELQDQSEV